MSMRSESDVLLAELVLPLGCEGIETVGASERDQPRSIAQQGPCERAPEETGRARQQDRSTLQGEQRAGLEAHHALRPPSMTRLVPVMYEEASEQRNRIAPLYSSVAAIRDERDQSAQPSDELIGLAVLDAARGNGVHAYAGIRPVRREVPRQAHQCRLHDGVGHGLYGLLGIRDVVLSVQPLVRRDDGEIGRDVHDHALLAARHLRPEDLAAQEGARQSRPPGLPPRVPTESSRAVTRPTPADSSTFGLLAALLIRMSTRPSFSRTVASSN